MASCRARTRWGRCSQRTDGGQCSAHRFWRQAGVSPDPYLEEKIVKGLKAPQMDWMSDSEAHAVINGRYRGDGRRIDQWTVPEGPMEIDLSPLLVVEVTMTGGPLDGVTVEHEGLLEDEMIVTHDGQYHRYLRDGDATYRWAERWDEE